MKENGKMGRNTSKEKGAGQFMLQTDFQKPVIGVDLGGTNIRAACFQNGKILKTFKEPVKNRHSKEAVLQQLKQAIQNVMCDQVQGVGIGVPGLVDLKQGIVYDLVNIPSWDRVPLKDELQNVFNLPVTINNDANCFALGEKYFGQGKDYRNLVGLTIGTGLGAGIIIENQLYSGANCGAGEFGMLPYKDKNFEYYCSGHFFKEVHNTSGEVVFKQAQNGDQAAKKIFEEFGYHLGKALSAVFYVLDPEIIVLGGSISKAFPFFKKSMWSSLQEVYYNNAIKKLKITQSTLNGIALYGASLLAVLNQ